jgi:hypothetical protein
MTGYVGIVSARLRLVLLDSLGWVVSGHCDAQLASIA